MDPITVNIGTVQKVNAGILTTPQRINAVIQDPLNITPLDMILAKTQEASVLIGTNQRVCVLGRYSETPQCPTYLNDLTITPGNTTALIEWDTSVEAFHRVGYREQGYIGDPTWSAFTDPASTHAAVTINGLEAEGKTYEIKGQSCLTADPDCTCDYNPDTGWETFQTTCIATIVLSNHTINSMFGVARFLFTSNIKVVSRHKWRNFPAGGWNPTSSYETSYVTSHNVLSSPILHLETGKLYEVYMEAKNRCGDETGMVYHYIIYQFYGVWMMQDF